MKRSFGKLLPASLAALVLASFAIAPYVDAAAGVRRWRRWRGGGARAAGGGGGGARAAGASGGGARATGAVAVAPGRVRRSTTARLMPVPTMSVALASITSTSTATSTSMSKVMAVAVAAGTMTTIRSRLQRRLALPSP